MRVGGVAAALREEGGSCDGDEDLLWRRSVLW